MLKNFVSKIKTWYNNCEPQDYYDPFSGLVFIAKKKDNKKEDK